MDEENNVQDSGWFIIIERVQNGYVLMDNEKNISVLEDDEQDELKSHQHLLWEVVEFFNFGGTKHDTERLRIVRERRKD